MISLKIKHGFVNLALMLAVLFFSLGLYSKVTPIPEYVDSLDNLKIAYNLAKYNKFSASNINGELTTIEGDTLAFFSPNIEKPVTIGEAKPTALREPLPIYLTSLILSKLDLIKKYPDLKSLNAGKPLMLIKSQNFIYLVLLFSGLILLLGLFIQQPFIRVLASILLLLLVCHYLTRSMYFLLCTELLASALMVWCSYFLIQAIHKPSVMFWLLAGFLFGLLVLTKAAFIYIGIVFVVLLFIYFSWLRQFAHYKGLACFALISVVIVMPWMIRNYQELNFLGISERAADVLLVRAEKNLMTPLERKGALCFYTSNQSLRLECARYFGFKEIDLSPTGRLKRIYRGHPQDLQARGEMDASKTISFYYHATTIAYKARYDAYLHNQSVIEANNATSKLAMKSILAHPSEHLLSTFLFAYRGLNIQHADIYSFLAFFALVGLGIMGVAQKNTSFLLVSLLPTLTFAFYAFLSHFIPRYSDPLIAFWMLGLVVVAYQVLGFIIKQTTSICIRFGLNTKLIVNAKE